MLLVLIQCQMEDMKLSFWWNTALVSNDLSIHVKWILMDRFQGGGVIDLMNRRLQQRLTEPEILKIFGDVCEVKVVFLFMLYLTDVVL